VGGASLTPTVSVANGGITNSKLALNSVTAANIADGSLPGTKIAGGAATLGSNVFTGSETMQQDLAVQGNFTAGTTTISGRTVSSPLFTINQSGGGPALFITGPGAAVSTSGGTEGISANGSNFGVLASSPSGTAVNAQSTSSYGVYASSTNATGIHADGGAVGADFSSASGVALQASTSNGGIAAVFSNSPGWFSAKLISGRYFSGTDSTERFSVDTRGNMFAAGALIAQYPALNGSVPTAGSVAALFQGSPAYNPAVVGTAPVGATTGVIGIVVGPGTISGTVQVAYGGIATCFFDAIINPLPAATGDYVGVSKSVAGECTDLGPNYPTSGLVLGRVLTEPAVGPFNQVMLFGPEQHGSLSTGALTGTSLSLTGSPSATAPIVSVNDSSPSSGTNTAISAYSRNNPAGLFIGDGNTIFSVGSSSHGILTVNNAGMNLVGNLTAYMFSGDGSALSNVNAAKLGGLAPTDLASNAALNSETNARQSGDATLQSNINAVSAAAAKLAASNTFTTGTQDFSGAGATLPVHAVLSTQVPATCVASKELLIETDATAGQQLFICNAGGNGWNLVGDGAAGGVASFNGRNGSVTAASGDYSFSQISGSAAASQMPAFSGDLTTSAGSTTTILSNTGVTAGTFTKITVDAKGRATSGAQAGFSDLAGAASSAQLPAAVVYNNQSNTLTGDQIVNGAVNANTFTGNGSGLSNVNAVALNGLASTSFAQLATPNTFAARQTFSASATSSASLNLPAGVAPSAPAAGDVWNTGAAIQYSDSSSTTRSLVSTTQSGGMQMLKITASITPSSVALSACSEQSFTVSGVNSGDVLLVVQQPSTSSPGNSIAIGGWRIPAVNTVAIQFCNVSKGNSHTPVSGTYTFALMR
jgi:hypothetical protein